MSEGNKISIIIPVYNEEKNIPELYKALKPVLLSLQNMEHEIIFVDDGSGDSSVRELVKLAEQDSRVSVIEFARNFGKEIATTAGMHHCRGNACIILDADLQHPVELIPQFIRKWQQGAEVVVGVREKNKGEGVVKKLGSFFYYKIINRISHVEITPRATDYRLLDRIVIDEYNRFTEKNRMTRALIDWLGFRRDYVNFDANPRRFGQASYRPLKLARLAVSSFVSHSLFPLKLAGYLGVIITFFSGALGLFIFIEKYVLNDPWNLNFSGPAILAVINLFLVGIILSCLGLIALYIANIHGEVINRPLYSIRRKRNFDERDL